MVPERRPELCELEWLTISLRVSLRNSLAHRLLIMIVIPRTSWLLSPGSHTTIRIPRLGPGTG